MERCRQHYRADSCLLLRRNRQQGCELRMAMAGAPVTGADRLPADSPLCRLDRAGMVLYQRSPLAACGVPARTLCFFAERGWRVCADAAAAAAAEEVAQLCGARSFISVPLAFRGGSARVIICSAGASFDRADVLFLEQLGGQVLPAIENIYLLDRLASLAALRQRRRAGARIACSQLAAGAHRVLVAEPLARWEPGDAAACAGARRLVGKDAARALKASKTAGRAKSAQADQLAVKMLLPLVLCIFPSIIMVIMGPAAIVILRTLLPLFGSK